MRTFERIILLALSLISATSWAKCPEKLTQLDTFEYAGSTWAACEDLQQPGGIIALVDRSNNIEWFSKGLSVYGSAHDDSFYLNLTKTAVMKDKADILAVKLLSKNYSFLTWDLVASAIPPIRHTGDSHEIAVTAP